MVSTGYRLHVFREGQVRTPGGPNIKQQIVSWFPDCYKIDPTNYNLFYRLDKIKDEIETIREYFSENFTLKWNTENAFVMDHMIRNRISVTNKFGIKMYR